MQSPDQDTDDATVTVGRHDGRRGGIEPVRTAIATLVGAIAGGLVATAVAGTIATVVIEPEGSGSALATLASVLLAAAVGVLGGAAVALGVLLRDAAPRRRRVAIATVLLVGPAASALFAAAMAATPLGERWDTRHLLISWAILVLPSVAVLGRWLAERFPSR